MNTGTPAAAPERHVSVTYVVMVAVAMVVGAGIFRSPAEIAANAGSAPWFFGAWLAGGVVSLAGALCFAELATMLPICRVRPWASRTSSIWPRSWPRRDT